MNHNSWMVVASQNSLSGGTPENEKKILRGCFDGNWSSHFFFFKRGWGYKTTFKQQWEQNISSDRSRYPRCGNCAAPLKMTFGWWWAQYQWLPETCIALTPLKTGSFFSTKWLDVFLPSHFHLKQPRHLLHKPQIKYCLAPWVASRSQSSSHWLLCSNQRCQQIDGTSKKTKPQTKPDELIRGQDSRGCLCSLRD